MSPIALRLKKRRRELTEEEEEEEESHGLSPDFTRINPSEAIGAIERKRVAEEEERFNRGERIESTQPEEPAETRDKKYPLFPLPFRVIIDNITAGK